MLLNRSYISNTIFRQTPIFVNKQMVSIKKKLLLYFLGINIGKNLVLDGKCNLQYN